MTSAVSRYRKPFTSVPEQARLLASRGLDIGTIDAAETLLRRHGYYRLSGYSHFYRVRDANGLVLDRFRTGSTLRDVVRLHEADSRLRQTLLRGLATLEIALRFHVGHRLGRRAAFAHRAPEHVGDEFRTWRAGISDGIARSRHHEWLRDYTAQERRAQDQFVSHFRRKYGPHLPVWASTEVMSLGTLSRLYEGMQENDQKLIAARFGVLSRTGDGDSSVFANWLNHLRHVRNIAAHHGRLWNRTLDVALSIPSTLPELAHLQEPAPRKVYGTGAVLRFLLARVDRGSNWHEGFTEALRGLSGGDAISPRDFGAHDEWASEHIWSRSYDADDELIRIADAIDEVDVVNTPQARALLTARAKPSDKKSWLRYLTSNNALIALRIGPQTYYPAFQFGTSDVDPVVADINEILFRELPDRGSPALRAVDVQRWWLTPSPDPAMSDSPLTRLASSPDAVRAEALRVGGGS